MAAAVTSMRIKPEISERYTRLAQETGRSKSYYLNQALEDAIERLEFEYRIMKDVEDYRAGRLETITIDELEERLGLAN